MDNWDNPQWLADQLRLANSRAIRAEKDADRLAKAIQGLIDCHPFADDSLREALATHAALVALAEAAS